MGKGRTTKYRRVVAKFGTSLLTGGGDRLDTEVMASLANQVALLHHLGIEVIIVTSGAVAAGRHKLGLQKERRDIPFKQVLASAGQSRLMNTYEELFAGHNVLVAQALLTRADLDNRSGYLNARNTLLALLELGVIPIINENDVVTIEELDGSCFGDNDNLSAMVANLVDADLLVMLTDTVGLCNVDPRRHPDAQLIPRVERIDETVERLAKDTVGSQGSGGMTTKIEAAKLATASGVTVVVAHGQESGVLPRLVSGEAIGTLFLPSTDKMESRKRWMLSGLNRKGTLVLDAGAVLALKKQNRSLLPAGISRVEGSFQRGDIVGLSDGEGNHLGSGITNYGSGDIDRIKGTHSGTISALLGYEYGAEVVHRNNLVML
ncbi:MAG: glutamate 5-kinase [Dehalococcoidia bacterium]